MAFQRLRPGLSNLIRLSSLAPLLLSRWVQALALSVQSMLLAKSPGTITVSRDYARRGTSTECSMKFLVSTPKIAWFVKSAKELALTWLETESRIISTIANGIYGLVCRSTEKERDMLA